MPAGHTMTKEELLNRLHRIEGQVRGLQRMIEEDRSCIDALTQTAAATGALRGVAVGLVDSHLRHCLGPAMTAGGDAAEQGLTETTTAIALLVRN